PARTNAWSRATHVPCQLQRRELPQRVCKGEGVSVSGTPEIRIGRAMTVLRSDGLGGRGGVAFRPNRPLHSFHPDCCPGVGRLGEASRRVLDALLQESEPEGRVWIDATE